MKTKLIKTVMAAAIAVVLASGLAIPASAADAGLPEVDIFAAVSEPGIMPLADVIVIRTRTYNGVRQYRRWNKTRMYWVDPDWIDC